MSKLATYSLTDQSLAELQQLSELRGTSKSAIVRTAMQKEYQMHSSDLISKSHALGADNVAKAAALPAHQWPTAVKLAQGTLLQMAHIEAPIRKSTPEQVMLSYSKNANNPVVISLCRLAAVNSEGRFEALKSAVR